MKGLVIAGTQSGSGKTTLSLALMAAYARRGLKVQAFKVGPDFIDPGHHALATGRPSHNVDGWMLGAEENRAIFQRHAARADLALVEGVMGLYDGFDPIKETGSTAEMAKLLGLPVLLAVDAKAMARSLAALAEGFAGFDQGLVWAGLAANRVGSPSHAALLAQVMSQAPGLPFLGGLPRKEDLAMPERHLGLVTAEDGGFGPEALDRLADWVEGGLDLDALWDGLPEIKAAPISDEQDGAAGSKVRLGVARDQAFCFYYEENLSRLRQAGAELVFFSPLNDREPPSGLDGMYLGGGYPELYAGKLAANQSMRAGLASLAQAGLPMYAECGGMMYLGQELTDGQGRSWPMVGALAMQTRMLPRLRSLGYREVRFKRATPLGPAGTRARGHEFHYSEVSAMDSSLDSGVYQAWGRAGELDGPHGYGAENILASYTHLHFGSNPGLAANLAAYCRDRKGSEND